jgi:hypothetical protein
MQARDYCKLKELVILFEEEFKPLKDNYGIRCDNGRGDRKEIVASEPQAQA